MYNECNLGVFDNNNDVQSEGGDGSTDALGMVPYRFESVESVGNSVSNSSSDEDEEKAEQDQLVLTVSFTSPLLSLCTLKMLKIYYVRIGVNVGIVQ